jgi:ABC-type uncharacterized transport system permease subunit
VLERFGFRFVPRSAVHGYVVFLVSLGAIVAAIVVTGFIFWAYGVNPFTAYATIVERTLLNSRGLSEVVRKSIPLLLVGVGLVLAFRAQFWNIGAEGQILAGAVGASGVALFVPLPSFVAIPAMFVAGFIAGALWGFLPAILKVRLGVNEIITTLMMNYIALYIVRWLINGPWKGESAVGFPYSDMFDRSVWLPTFGTTRLHWPTLVLGLFLAVFVAFLVTRMRLGFEIRLMGENPIAARYAGVNILFATTMLVALSAGAAGLAGVGEVAGIHHRLIEPNSISLGFGYTAIIVAMLARGSPIAAVFTALFLGWVFASGDIMKVTLGLPFQITGVINGLVLLFIISSEPLLRFRIERIRVGRPNSVESETELV